MADVTQILAAIEAGDPNAAAELLPRVYDELRKLAAARMRAEAPGHTLQPTALVHEAYIRLVSSEPARHWNGRNHFFAVAAQAMRRILIESARRKALAPRIDFAGFEPAVADDSRLLELHDALELLAASEPLAAKVVEARLFAGLSVDEAAAALGLSHATAYREWTFARAWLATALSDNSEKK
jgi:RNA polymerase sigma factor (TIGR02999 family)